MKSIRAALLLAAAFAVSPALAEGLDDRGFDPIGIWHGQQCPLALVNESPPAGLLVRYAGRKQTTRASSSATPWSAGRSSLTDRLGPAPTQQHSEGGPA